MNAPLQTPLARRPKGRLRALADLFNSIWLGIFFISSILLYGTLGSAIPGLRQFFELGEFQYFNHWIFLVLILLFCTNLTVTTIRRIKFNRINAGVLSVHTGLLTLCAGSIIYFGNKVEGNVWLGAPMVKVYSIDRFQTDRDNAFIAQFVAVPGEVWEQNIPMLGGKHRIEVSDVRHEGLTTASYVKLKAKAGDLPEETIELRLSSAGEAGRIAKFTERFALVLSGSDESSYFYDDTTPALIIPQGEDRANWAHFELPALPYYHERFVEYAAGDPAAKDRSPIEDTDGRPVESARLDPIPAVERWRMPFSVIDSSSVIAEDLPVTIEVDGYLPYAELEPKPFPGGDRTFPIARVKYEHGHGPHSEWLVSESPERAMVEFHDGPRVEFRWIGEQTKLDPAWTSPLSGRHVLNVFIKDKNIRKSFDVQAGQIIPIEGTDYTLTIDELRPSWPLMTAGFKNAKTPIALVIVKTPAMEFQRSVMQRFPQLNQDRHPQSHPEPQKRGQKVDPARDIVDDNIELTYADAATDHFSIVAGENLAPMLIHTKPGGDRSVQKLDPGQPCAFRDSSLTLEEFIDKPRFESVPVVIPPSNRRSLMDVRREKSVVRLLLKSKDGQWLRHVWVPFSPYNTDNFFDQVPETVVDGVPGVGQLRFIYGRAVRPLPTTITLEQLKTDMYPGELQPREWTSHFRYRDPRSGQIQKGRAHLNNTYTIGDWTLFQSHAAGDRKSWTILGVGNRRGVWTMLVGCTLIALGMTYAFSIKPVLLRRRREQFARLAGRGI
ncbi:MAG TPA: hypothetical protein VNT79_13345 [Phycisphaerae bacterium]|nr:hypothetical protein [Phycisphaerae bacterium]